MSGSLLAAGPDHVGRVPLHHNPRSHLVAHVHRGGSALAFAALACPAALNAAATGRGITTSIVVGDATLTTLTHGTTKLGPAPQAVMTLTLILACAVWLSRRRHLLPRLPPLTYNRKHWLAAMPAADSMDCHHFGLYRQSSCLSLDYP